MISVENAIPWGIESQFNIPAELRWILNYPELTLQNIKTFIAEFACKNPLNAYHYSQEGEVLVSPLTGQNVLEMSWNGINWDSDISVWQHQGLHQMVSKIITAREPSVVVLPYAPGSKKEGYGEYGFLNLAFIPRLLEGARRRISMLNVLVEPFNRQAVHDLLKELDLERELPAGSSIKDLLTHPIMFPIGKGSRVEDVIPLIKLINDRLQLGFDKEVLAEGDSGVSLRRISEQYRPLIHDIFNRLWMLAKNYPYEIDGAKFFQAYNIFKSFKGGYCPSMQQQQISSGVPVSVESKDSSNTKENELHFCPKCGMFFKGTKCGCGWSLQQANQ